ncbi:GTP cyclohydrolase II [Aspergillus luchuensis]|uniref:GTP cyclohydrolase II n=1 Tax=Aspergillus kawachii TaxID=1069201 RepID=A0A146FZ64_ASPKA|nr:GTP cyclohydrolase II [Aspergillus luchuensis]
MVPAFAEEISDCSKEIVTTVDEATKNAENGGSPVEDDAWRILPSWGRV